MLVFAVVIVLAIGVVGTFAPLSDIQARPVSLDPVWLPWYAVRTVLRMLAAMAASLIFTLTYGTLAAKNRRAEIALVSLLDTLQSVPVLGYLSFNVLSVAFSGAGAWCPSAGSANAPSLGSAAADGWPRTGNASTAKRSRSSASPPSASCCENYAIPHEVSGQALRY